MNKVKFKYAIILFFVGISVYSCKIQKQRNEKTKISHQSSQFLIEQLSKNEFQFNTLSTKASVVVDDGKKKSFKTHIRIKKDSAIWISITPVLGIEIARLLVTKDTVKFMNRIQKEYFTGDFDYINKLFQTDLDYQMMEALLIGNSLSFDSNDKKIKSSIDRKKSSYYLSTEKKRKVRKEIKKDKGKLKNQTQAIWLDPENYKINEILLSSQEDPKSRDQSLTGIYSNQTEIDNQLFPYQLDFILQSANLVKININYTKISPEKAVSFSFKIPSKYVQIKQ